MADGATDGHEQLTILLPEAVASFGAWVEQLVAESTGKQALGLLPVVDEPVLAPEAYGDHRLVVAYGEHPGLDDIAARGVPVVRLDAIEPADLPAEVFRWELATALAGALIGINPFDQPNVQAAKAASTRMLEEGGAPPEPMAVADLLDQVGPGDYVALLAFVDPGGDVAARLPGIAARLREARGGPGHRGHRAPVPALDGPAAQGRTRRWRVPGPGRGRRRRHRRARAGLHLRPAPSRPGGG